MLLVGGHEEQACTDSHRYPWTRKATSEARSRHYFFSKPTFQLVDSYCPEPVRGKLVLLVPGDADPANIPSCSLRLPVNTQGLLTRKSCGSAGPAEKIYRLLMSGRRRGKPSRLSLEGSISSLLLLAFSSYETWISKVPSTHDISAT